MFQSKTMKRIIRAAPAPIYQTIFTPRDYVNHQTLFKSHNIHFQHNYEPHPSTVELSATYRSITFLVMISIQFIWQIYIADLQNAVIYQ